MGDHRRPDGQRAGVVLPHRLEDQAVHQGQRLRRHAEIVVGPDHDRTPEARSLRLLQEDVRRRPQLLGHGRLFLPETRLRNGQRGRIGRHLGQGNHHQRLLGLRTRRHHLVGTGRMPDRILRTPQLRLQGQISADGHLPRGRIVEIRQRRPLGLLPGYFGRLGADRRALAQRHPPAEFPQTARQLRFDRKQRLGGDLRRLRFLRRQLHVQREFGHQTLGDAQRETAMGDLEPARHRHRSRPVQKPHLRKRRFLRQAHAQPALRTEAAQHDGLLEVLDQPRQSPLLGL